MQFAAIFGYATTNKRLAFAGEIAIEGAPKPLCPRRQLARLCASGLGMAPGPGTTPKSKEKYPVDRHQL